MWKSARCYSSITPRAKPIRMMMKPLIAESRNPWRFEVLKYQDKAAVEEFVKSKGRTMTPLKYYQEVYGCQMNVNDSQLVDSIMQQFGHVQVEELEKADAIFLMTCSIRENAEDKIWNRLKSLQKYRLENSAMIGCMAGRVKSKLLQVEKLADLVCGPDAYRTLPFLVELSKEQDELVGNTVCSLQETYQDLLPNYSASKHGVSAFLSIMRGCNNMCSFCVVPFTRGIERSRSLNSIITEAGFLINQGVKEITLLGQNVNSYCGDIDDVLPEKKAELSNEGFQNLHKRKPNTGVYFSTLLKTLAQTFPKTRFRFTSPHPKDFPLELLSVIAEYPNICKALHLPAQSGSNSVLHRMRRGYSREAYLQLVEDIRKTIPQATLSTDIITGFCGETEQEHQDTLSLLKEARFSLAYMFAYSMREKTHAFYHYQDDVSLEVKKRRLDEVIKLFHEIAWKENQRFLGTIQLVLVEKPSKKDVTMFSGKLDGHQRVVITKSCSRLRPGDWVRVLITAASSKTLQGEMVKKLNEEETDLYQ